MRIRVFFGSGNEVSRQIWIWWRSMDDRDWLLLLWKNRLYWSAKRDVVGSNVWEMGLERRDGYGGFDRHAGVEFRVEDSLSREIGMFFSKKKM